MKYLLLFFLLSFLSCQDNATPETNLSFEDSVRIDREARAKVDSMMTSMAFDTVGVSEAPIKVINARLVKREYSNYKDISLTYKNISDKKVSAVRFAWYGETAFGDAADMGTSVREGFGGGFDDEGLRPGKSKTAQWSILSRNAKKVVLAWPTEVAFEDGSKWESNRKN